MRHEIYLPTKVCSECRGKCCSRCPGPYHPSDFPKPITAEYLLELLENRTIVIDWRQPNGRATYFLRPPCVQDNGHYVSFHSLRGECSFLAERGCSLPVERRPLGCRSLKPSNNGSRVCRTTYTQYKAFRSWARHRRVLERIMDIVERRKKGDFSLKGGGAVR